MTAFQLAGQQGRIELAAPGIREPAAAPDRGQGGHARLVVRFRLEPEAVEHLGLLPQQRRLLPGQRHLEVGRVLQVARDLLAPDDLPDVIDGQAAGPVQPPRVVPAEPAAEVEDRPADPGPHDARIPPAGTAAHDLRFHQDDVEVGSLQDQVIRGREPREAAADDRDGGAGLALQRLRKGTGPACRPRSSGRCVPPAPSSLHPPVLRPGPPARMDRHQHAVARPQRDRRVIYDPMTGDVTELVALRERCQQQVGLHHREVLADAQVGPGAEGDVGEPVLRLPGLRGEPIRVEDLGLGPVLGMAVDVEQVDQDAELRREGVAAQAWSPRRSTAG